MLKDTENIFAETKKKIEIYHWSKLFQLPKRKYLIKGLLEHSASSVIYGASNSGKTFVALDLACHIALGWKWRNKNTCKGTVVYIAAEGGLGIFERLEAFRINHDLKDYADLHIIPSNICLCKDESAHEDLILELNKLENIKLIVIDTLARAMGSGDENSTSDMGSFIQNCDIIRHHTKAHVMMIHHSGKDQSKGARGSTALKGAIDTEMQVTQTGGVISATVTKQREGKVNYSLDFTLKEIEVGKDEDGDPQVSCSLVNAEISPQKQRLAPQTHNTFQVLIDLMLEKGVSYTPKNGMSLQKCVRLDDFRDWFIKAGVADTDNKDSVSRAFKRQTNILKDKGYIGEWDKYFWILNQTDK